MCFALGPTQQKDGELWSNSSMGNIAGTVCARNPDSLLKALQMKIYFCSYILIRFF